MGKTGHISPTLVGIYLNKLASHISLAVPLYFQGSNM
jgi:hypothetical protein